MRKHFAPILADLFVGRSGASFRVEARRDSRGRPELGPASHRAGPWLSTLALVLVSGCVKQEAPPLLAGSAIEADRPGLQELVLTRQADGKSWKLADDRGSVVLLDVWATWCDPCRDSLPMYQDLLRQYEAKGLKVYGINVDADPRNVPAFLKELKVDLPVLLDPGANLVESALRVKVMPTAFLVDRNGKLRHVHEGFAEEFLQRYLSEIEELVAEK